MTPSRHFIGPLTPAQQERRRRARDRYQHIAEIVDARYISFREALEVLKWQRAHRFSMGVYA